METNPMESCFVDSFKKQAEGGQIVVKKKLKNQSKKKLFHKKQN
jgi:hypothetical protein